MGFFFATSRSILDSSFNHFFICLFLAQKFKGKSINRCEDWLFMNQIKFEFYKDWIMILGKELSFFTKIYILPKINMHGFFTKILAFFGSWSMFDWLVHIWEVLISLSMVKLIQSHLKKHFLTKHNVFKDLKDQR